MKAMVESFRLDNDLALCIAIFNNVAGDGFKIVVLLYDGDYTTAFGGSLFALPLGVLWS